MSALTVPWIHRLCRSLLTNTPLVDELVNTVRQNTHQILLLSIGAINCQIEDTTDGFRIPFAMGMTHLDVSQQTLKFPYPKLRVSAFPTS